MSSSRRSIPTVDRISDLPEPILCHILSFLPTKDAATTGLLSKRWKPLWLSILTFVTLDFDHRNFQNFNEFREFVYSSMFSLRDNTQTQLIHIHSLTFKCGKSCRFQQKDFNLIFKIVNEVGIQNLDFDMWGRIRLIRLPTRIFSFKTLQTLKVTLLKMGDFHQVNFPRLKTLFLDRVYFISVDYIVKFLLGCPVLEYLHTRAHIDYRLKVKPLVPIENLNALPNLVKVNMDWNLHTPLTLVCKTKILHVIEVAWLTWTRLPMFPNLTHLELSFHGTHFCKMKCNSLLGFLPHFPNLQHFKIQDYAIGNDCYCNCWKHPPTVPECLSSQLKTCYIRWFRGTQDAFEFAKYIMQHSKVLETMTFKSDRREEYQMWLKLSSSIMGSTTCKLLFDR